MKSDDPFKTFVLPDGRVVRLPKIPISTLRGMLHRPGQQPVTIEEMDEAVATGASERDFRSKDE